MMGMQIRIAKSFVCGLFVGRPGLDMYLIPIFCESYLARCLTQQARQMISDRGLFDRHVGPELPV